MINLRQKRVVSIILKLTVVILAGWFIYQEVFINLEPKEIQVYFEQVFSSSENGMWLLLALVLMPLNWSIESMKWRFLISKLEKISFLRAISGVFAGVTISTVTPNRTGEFAGRILALRSGDRIKAVLATLLGSVSQLLVTIVAGSGMLVIYLLFYQPELLSPALQYIIISLVVLINILLVLFYLNASLFTFLLSKLPWKEKIGTYAQVFSYYTTTELVKVVLQSFFRYTVFTFQYYCLLQTFQVEVNAADAMVLLPLTFFALTVIPSVALTEMGVREMVAVYFIGMVAENKLGIVVSSFSLWAVNLAVPATLGAILLFGLKVFPKHTD